MERTIERTIKRTIKRISGPTVAALAGIIGWFVVATIVDRALRAAWPAYAAVWSTLAFALPMLLARLAIGAFCSVVAGAIAQAVGRAFVRRIGTSRDGIAPLAVAALLLVMFVPQHVVLWDRFPWWYHGVFVASLCVGPLVGGRLARAMPLRMYPAVIRGALSKDRR